MSPTAIELLHPWFVAFAACFGAVVGSFLNVVIARVPEGRSIVAPRSACPRCGAAIDWYDNVPLLSWALLRARCRRCRAPISWRYPAVELLVAIAAVAALERHGPTAAALFEFGYVAVLVALAFIDLATWLLPHALTRPLLLIGLLASVLHVGPASSVRTAAYGAALGFAVLWLVATAGRALLKKEAMGGGDLWLLAALGAWNGAAALLPILLLASIQGSVVGLVLIAAGRGQPGPAPSAPTERSAPSAAPTGAESKGAESKYEPGLEDDTWIPPRNAVPFGPFLVAGALEWLYLGGELAHLIPALEIFR